METSKYPYTLAGAEAEYRDRAADFRRGAPNTASPTHLDLLLVEYDRRASALAAVEAERDALRAARDRVLETCDSYDQTGDTLCTYEIRALLAVPGEKENEG